MFLQCCVAAVKLSVESVLESLISVYENHYRDNRPLSEESVAEEFQIAINGPNVAHYDSVVLSAMSHYWGDENKKTTTSSCWHFKRKTIDDDESLVVKRLYREDSKLPFMQ